MRLTDEEIQYAAIVGYTEVAKVKEGGGVAQ